MPRGRNLYDSLYQHLVCMPDGEDSAPNFLMTCSAWRMRRDAGDACIDMLPRDLKQMCLLEDMRNCAGCDVLMTRPAAMRCAVCRVEYYCSLRCQNKHWPKHKKMCGPISKRDRRLNEAMQTASRVVWVLYTQRVKPTDGAIPHMMSKKFALDTRDCLLARFKPDAHDRLLTIVLLTKKQVEIDAPRTPKANKRQVLVATFLEPQKLLVALKSLLRDSLSYELTDALEGEEEYLREMIQTFRNSVIQLHTMVKKFSSVDSSLERARNGTHLFVLITPMQADWCNMLCFRCMQMQANFSNSTTLCTDLVSEFGESDRAEYEENKQAVLLQNEQVKKRVKKLDKKMQRAARGACQAVGKRMVFRAWRKATKEFREIRGQESLKMFEEITIQTSVLQAWHEVASRKADLSLLIKKAVNTSKTLEKQ